MLKILDRNYKTLAYLNNIQDITIREIINGEYTLSFKGNIEELKTAYLYDENNILGIDNDYFRPLKIVDERTSNGMTHISCQAEHISYDLINTKFADFKYIYKDINVVMLACLQGTGFSYQGSDITLKTDIQYEQETNTKAITITIANDWKGELKYFQKQIWVLSRRGADRGVQFRLGKNLKSVRRTVDRKEKDEQGNPKILYEVDILDLREQKGYENLEYFELGDTIKVIDELLGIEIKARIIEWEYNPLKRENTKIKLGNELQDIRGSLSGINENRKQIQEVKKDISQSRVDWDKINKITNNLGQVIASEITGNLNTALTMISNANGTVTVDSNGILIHDQPSESNSTWAMRLNSTGFMIANSKNLDGSWNFKTFGTGAGFTADMITAGVIKGLEIQGVNILGSTITGGTVNGVNINGSNIEGGSVKMGTTGKDYMKIDSSGLSGHRIVNGIDMTNIMIEQRDFGIADWFFNGFMQFNDLSYTGSQQIVMGYAPAQNSFVISGIGNNNNKLNIAYFNGGVTIDGGRTGVDINGNGGLQVNGRLRVWGDKNSIVATENYGNRLLYAYETDKCYFATQGQEKLKDGICTIEISPVFLETIENEDYHILLTSKDKFIDLFVSDVQKDRFTVKSDTVKDGSFFYTFSAIRKGYKYRYLDEVKEDESIN